jgi:glutamate racemase
MTAGVFDSGVGGLTVAKSLIDAKIFEEIVYYGDTARVPYGSKDENTIVRYSLEAVEFFKNFGIDILIVACNTASSYALEEMRKIAPFEIVGVIDPGVISIKKQNPTKNASILVTGTKATINSGKYQKILQNEGFSNVTAIETGLFVSLVEDGIFDGELMNSALKHYFANISEPDFIILGCTHFPLISEAIQGYFKNSKLVHSGEAIVEYLESTHSIKPSMHETNLRLFASSSPDRLKETATNWLKGSDYKCIKR